MMTSEQIHQFSQDVLRIRRSLDHSTELMLRAHDALRVAGAKLEALTAVVERLNHEQHS